MPIRRKEITVTAGTPVVNSAVWVPDFSSCAEMSLGIGFVVSSGASLEYTLQYTFDDPWDQDLNTSTDVTWFAAASPADATGDLAITWTRPCTGFRIQTAATGTGSVTATFVQMG